MNGSSGELTGLRKDLLLSIFPFFHLLHFPAAARVSCGFSSGCLSLYWYNWGELNADVEELELSFGGVVNCSGKFHRAPVGVGFVG